MNDEFLQSDNRKSGALGRWAPLVLIVVVLGFLAFAQQSSEGPTGWLATADAAFAKSEATKNPVVIAFYGEGCPPCVAMDRTVLGTAEVQDALVGYVPVRIDANIHPELSGKYGVQFTPTFLIVDPEGKVLARAEGFIEVDDFVSFLNRGRLVAGR